MYNTRIRVAIAGAEGRMGKQLIQAALQMNNIILLSAAIVRNNSSFLGMDVGELIGNAKKTGIIVKSSINSVKEDFDVLIDFTCPKSTLSHLEFCRKHHKKIVIGTTGFDDVDKRVIHEASYDIAIVFSPNFSVGINIILKLLEKITKLMNNCTDIDIIESHHRYKIDAPSGTAIAMGETIAKVLNKNFKECATYSYNKYVGERMPGTINFTVVRAGDIIGEHTVMFSDIGERIEISHKVSNRITFANGAMKSAAWLKEVKNGLFNMKDVLKLSNF